jgi:hypothetical protein
MKSMPVAVLSLPDKGYKEVIIKGSWDGWKQELTTELKEGLWVARVSLPLRVYTYKYRADGEWLVDEEQPTTDSSIQTRDNILDMTKLPVYVNFWKHKLSLQQRI